MTNPFFSICIPAYKNAAHLQRLLESVFKQSFTDYEVVITDDTPDETIRVMLAEQFAGKPIQYFHNNPPSGTPENWNAAIRKAKGQWIKLMHNDDWFASETVLQIFHNKVCSNPGTNFFFSAFVNITETTGHRQPVRMNSFDKFFLKCSPYHLFRKVYIGNPSCTLVKNHLGIEYNHLFKFVVDFDYYIRLIKAGNKYEYINEYLLNIGFHDEQVTQYTKLNPSVQIYENITLLKQYGNAILRNIFVFDYFWRLFRNINVTSENKVKQYFKDEIPKPLIQMLGLQSGIPLKILKMGLFSKAFMFFAYLRNLIKN